MYCIIVTGIPASGKTVLAEYLSASLHIPVVLKDKIKEILFDTIGFRSRTEKVALGTGAMEAMYYFADQMMRTGQPFLLENNFENVSREINIQPVLTQEEFIRGITERGMVEFQLPGPVMEIDTTDFSKMDLRHVTEELRNIISGLKLQ